MKRAAPAWSGVLQASPAWRLAQCTVAALAAASCSLWLLQWAPWWPWHGGAPTLVRFIAAEGAWLSVLLAAVGASVAAAGVWRCTAPAAPVALAFDGESWQLAGQPGHLEVMVDLDDWLLMRHRATLPAAGTRTVHWLAASRTQRGLDWHGLRAALYSRPPAPRSLRPPTPDSPRDPC